MTANILFVGDVHGEAKLLKQCLSFADSQEFHRIVFLGDYVNRGNSSAEVLDLLSDRKNEEKYVFLRGNHDQAMLRALTSRKVLTAFLKMGGAKTIQSYLRGKPIGPAVFEEFRSCVATKHIEFLESTCEKFEESDVIASHKLIPEVEKTQIVGHTPVGEPQQRGKTIYVDTGAGMPDGCLTALVWPSCEAVQFM